jgi:hypothetical protein
MSTPHKATPSDWAWLEGNSTVDRCDAAWSRGLVELRARVEALEAGATCPHVRTSDEGSSYCTLAEQHQDKLDRLIAQDRAASADARPAPASSLVERVAIALAESDHPHQLWHDDARAAIREVAAWLRTGRLLHAAELLEQEANR